MRKLLFFHADWCNPCKMVERTCISKIEEACGADCITRVDIQNSSTLANKYSVWQIPTTIFLDDDKACMRVVGTFAWEDRAEWLKGGK